MGLRFILGYEAGIDDTGAVRTYPHSEIAVLWDSVTETAFGPTFRSLTDDGEPGWPALTAAMEFLNFCEARHGVEDLRAVAGKAPLNIWEEDFYNEVHAGTWPDSTGMS